MARKNPCEYHASIVALLKPKETILSFNYDCVMDHALRSTGEGKWSSRHGYCFPHPDKVEGYAAWDAPKAPTNHNQSINLLKLHGSLNWFPFPAADDGVVRLRERPYKQKGNKDYEIVPPEYVKSFDTRPIYSKLWGNAELAIRGAKELVFIGFSFTPADLHVEALFRVALADKPSLEQVVIVNPNSDHRRRIRSVISSSLTKGARVTQFDLLRDAHAHLGDVLSK